VDKDLKGSMNPGAASDIGHWRRWAERSDGRSSSSGRERLLPKDSGVNPYVVAANCGRTKPSTLMKCDPNLSWAKYI